MVHAEQLFYLDYDGVGHDKEVYTHPKRGVYIRTPGRVLFEWMPILEELVEPHPDVKIVLATSWVVRFGFTRARSYLPPALQKRVIGATFHNRHMRKAEFENMPRGEQIVQDVYRRGPKSWFAIDDDDHRFPSWCRDNLIKTDGARGLSDPAIQDAIRHMLARF